MVIPVQHPHPKATLQIGCINKVMYADAIALTLYDLTIVVINLRPLNAIHTGYLNKSIKINYTATG